MSEDYFSWLAGLTHMSKSSNPAKTYWSLLHQLHAKPFRVRIVHDRNRAEDALELRDEYLDVHGHKQIDEDLLDMAPSILEVLVALSRRVAFNSYGQPDAWFWKLLENIGFLHFSDAQYNHRYLFIEGEVDEALRAWIDRKYASDGHGGLFPLRRAGQDQRRVELWYQMSAYLLEGSDVNNGP